MNSKRGIDRTWINYIDSTVLDVYPIQFSNCDRLQKNDAVYIFDEVGSGKTISSGLMALDFLINNPQEEVYIITTNALVKKGSHSEYGQFLKDWYEKLPFYTLGLTNRIKVSNNHYSNIRLLKKCGLLIIDETQLFLNDESLRNKYLRKIRSKKIVFLTATPIKTSKNDLYTYVSLAKEIIQNNKLDDKWIEDISTEGKNSDSIICSVFDDEYPVTRYFKDTIMSINVKGYKKRQARRLIPQLWEYYSSDGNNKNDVLLDKINKYCSVSTQSRFVVFTRFVEKEANAIGEFLKTHGFCPFDSNTYTDDKTYKIVTGNNSYELSHYSGQINLPTVLILTYQIAEQGVNLPGYNYVINYHISAFPSALEQRFGRIDRMNNISPEINMCFLISKDSWDTNTWNFYSAMSVYLSNLLTYLPSKNTILSEEIVEKYLTQRANIEKFIQRIEELIESDQQINFITEFFEKTIKPGTQEVECKCDKDLFSFIDENSIEIDIEFYGNEREEAIKRFKREVISKLKEYKDAFNSGQLSNLQIKNIIKNSGDKIFYQTKKEIHTVDAIKECGVTIAECEQFICYKTNFSEKVRLPLAVKKYIKLLNEFFENKFIENDFNVLFPFEGYSEIFNNILNPHAEISEEEKLLLINNSKSIVRILPFFKMCLIFKNIIQNMESRMRWGMVCYDYNQFQSAFYQIFHKIRQSDVRLGLSYNFFKKYFDEEEEYIDWYDRCYDKHCNSSVYVNSRQYYNIKRDNNILQATNWYKLAYHFTRKEACCYTDSLNWCSGESNIYYIKEKLIKYLVENNKAYKVAMDRKMGIYGEPEQPEIIGEYKMEEDKLIKIIHQIDEQSDEQSPNQSLFSFYSLTESRKIRKYSFDKPLIRDEEVYVKDIWTQGIIYELFEKKRYNNCMIGNIYSSPEILKNIHICY